MNQPPPPPPLQTLNTFVPENQQTIRCNAAKSLTDILATRKAQSNVKLEDLQQPSSSTVSQGNVDKSNTVVPSLPKITCKVCKNEIMECLYDSHITSHCNEILPIWLYLGAERNAKEVWRINREQFTHVISVAEEVPTPLSNVVVVGTDESSMSEQEISKSKKAWVVAKIGDIYRYHVSIKDLPGQDLQVFSDMADEINRIKKESEKSEDIKRNLKILVHCVQGISRSTTVIIAYLIKYKQMNLKQAYDFVRERRSIAKPRKEFIEELQNIENEVFGFEKPTLFVEDTLVGSIVVNVDPII